MPVTAIDNHPVFTMGLRDFELFRSLVHERAGIWLRDSKQIMLASRLSCRLRHHGLANFADYYSYIQNIPDNSEEICELINCVTTNKTAFFRERHHFDFLANTIVPEVQSAPMQGAGSIIRVWSAASSTGEEPYSIAITLLEALRPPGAAKNTNPPDNHYLRNSDSGSISPTNAVSIEIVASDVDTKVLSIAQRAIYNAQSLVSVAPPLIKKYFLRGKDQMIGQVKVKPEVVRLVQFQRINLIDAQWALEGLFDVIFFRNALIYFNRSTQEVFLRRIARHLKPRGHLFLGHAEHIPWLNDILEPLNQTMYRLRDGKR